MQIREHLCVWAWESILSQVWAHTDKEQQWVQRKKSGHVLIICQCSRKGGNREFETEKYLTAALDPPLLSALQTERRHLTANTPILGHSGFGSTLSQRKEIKSLLKNENYLFKKTIFSAITTIKIFACLGTINPHFELPFQIIPKGKHAKAALLLLFLQYHKGVSSYPQGHP